MNILEQTSHVIKLLSLLEKAEPAVKPPFAEKYGWEWDDDINHWVSPDHYDDNVSLKYDTKNDKLEEVNKDTLAVGNKAAVVDFTHDKRMEVGKVLQVGDDRVNLQFEDGSIDEFNFDQIRGIHGKGSKDIPEGYFPVGDRELQLGDKVFIPSEDKFGIISNLYDDGRVQVGGYGWDPDLLYIDTRSTITYTGENKQSSPGFSETGFDITQVQHYKEIAEEIEERIKSLDSYVNARSADSIYQYTVASYKDINNSLYRGQPNKDAQIISKFMRTMGDEPLTLYRNTGLDLNKFLNDNRNPAQVGDMITLKSFSSTSRNPGKAWGYKSYDKVVLEIQTDSNTRAMSLSNSETYDPYEFETILDYGQRIEILDIRYVKDNVTNDWMKPVITCKIVSSNDVNLQKSQSKITQEFAEEHGFEWNAQKQRYIQLIGV